MVNLFWFSCPVIDRAYASTDCTGGVGKTIKRKGGVSQACLGKSTSFLFDIHIRSTTFIMADCSGGVETNHIRARQVRPLYLSPKAVVWKNMQMSSKFIWLVELF